MEVMFPLSAVWYLPGETAAVLMGAAEEEGFVSAERPRDARTRTYTTFRLMDEMANS